jgi:hypothetical protein
MSAKQGGGMLVQALTHSVIGSFYEVHTRLGFGFPPERRLRGYLARRIFSRTMRFFSSTNTSLGSKFSSSLSS